MIFRKKKQKPWNWKACRDAWEKEKWSIKFDVRKEKGE